MRQVNAKVPSVQVGKKLAVRSNVLTQAGACLKVPTRVDGTSVLEAVTIRVTSDALGEGRILERTRKDHQEHQKRCCEANHRLVEGGFSEAGILEFVRADRLCCFSDVLLLWVSDHRGVSLRVKDVLTYYEEIQVKRFYLPFLCIALAILRVLVRPFFFVAQIVRALIEWFGKSWHDKERPPLSSLEC